MEANEARERLTDQIKLLSRFLYLYGRISGTIETAERGDGGARTAGQSRDALAANVANVRAGLDDLAEQFSRAPSLARLTPRITAASDLVAQAETSIADGDLDQAGRNLVAAVGNLTDALALMR